ncbi:hypothetical protein M407DRAFT_226002 [Tulasnella calospora MUT 4182]|uniref:Uncharacterized protein n=1 Tax=Tulasnella calospora MUT 4182 TaxID=1051891 RepID=A0A0C3M884_9AGAM|nr:hypothetical protein M407DRAFT_226002 [Tulasnella calospora MUT 4182]
MASLLGYIYHVQRSLYTMPSLSACLAKIESLVPTLQGWPSRLRVKTGLGLHLRGKLSFKAKTKKPGSSRPPSLESLPEWDPQFYASTMEAERRAVAERKHAAVTIRKEEHRRAELFNWPPEAVLRPLSPPMTQHAGDVIDGADTTSARSAVPPGTPDLLDASNSMVDLPKELPPLPASEPKPGNVSTTSPTPETKQGSPLQHEIVSARSAAKQTDIRLPVGNPNPKEADEGSKDSESEDSDRDDETPRASMIGVPNGFAAAMVRQPTQSGHPPARGINRRDTLKATSTNHPRTERTRQPRPPSRGHQNPELALLHHVPPVSETEIHGRGSTEQSNAPPNRQVGLSAKVMWARQLRYRLDFCDKIGDRRTYAAAAQEALAAGYVICPNHVLRRASAIIPIDMALFPNNPADL